MKDKNPVKKCKACGAKLHRKIILKTDSKDLKFVKNLMNKNNWQQKDIAAAIGITKMAISCWFRRANHQKFVLKPIYRELLRNKRHIK